MSEYLKSQESERDKGNTESESVFRLAKGRRKTTERPSLSTSSKYPNVNTRQQDLNPLKQLMVKDSLSDLPSSYILVFLVPVKKPLPVFRHRANLYRRWCPPFISLHFIINSILHPLMFLKGFSVLKPFSSSVAHLNSV